MQNRTRLFTFIAVIVISLFAFGAMAQDPTAEPTLDPALTVVPTDLATIEPTLDVTVDVTVDVTLDATVEPTLDVTADVTLDPTVDTVATTDPAATTDPGMMQPTATVEGTEMLLFGSVSVHDLADNSVGSVIFTTMGDGKVMMTANFVNLPPGIHGIHVHSVGDCENPGPHFNPAGMDHPSHAGDLPALFVNNDGTASMTVVTDRFAVADLFDADGSTLSVHAQPDNYAHIPPRYSPDSAMATPDPALPMTSVADAETLEAGDSGDPIACGVVEEGFMAIVPSVDETATPDDGVDVEPTLDATLTLDAPTLEASATLDPNVTLDPTGEMPTVDPALTETLDPALTPVDVTLVLTVDPSFTLEPTLGNIPPEPSPTAVEQ